MLYSYRHLLQILAVKYLQSQYLPLVKIRSLVENADNRDLESMIPAVAPATSTHRSLARSDRAIPEVPYHFPAPAAHPPSAPEPSPRSADARPPEVPPQRDLWHRVEVAPGVELHVLDAALAEEHRERLRGALLREIGALRGWGEKR